jgi:hypothetical protein
MGQYDSERAAGDNAQLISSRERLKESLKPIIKKCADHFLKCLEDAAKKEAKNKKRRLAKQNGIDREAGVKDATYLYPVFFVFREEYESLVKDDLANRKMQSPPKDDPSVQLMQHLTEIGQSLGELFAHVLNGKGSNNMNLQWRYPMERPYEDAKVYVGWTRAFVQDHNETSRGRISSNFLVALASWYGLVAMERDLAFRLLGALHARAAHRGKFQTEIRILRHTYLEAANAARPIQWVSKEKDILLLDTIHEAWGSDRLRQSIDERTQSLAAYCEDVNAKAAQKAATRLTTIGLLIAGLALGSVTKDMIDLFDNHQKLFWLVLAVLVVVVVIGIIWSLSYKYKPEK